MTRPFGHPKGGAAAAVAALTMASPARFDRLVIAPDYNDATTSVNVSAYSDSALPATGKFYFEVDCVGGLNLFSTSGLIGLWISGANYFGVNTGIAASRIMWNNAAAGVAQATTSPALATPASVKFAVDMDTGDIWFGTVGGGWDVYGGASPDPATGTNPAITMTSITGAKVILSAWVNGTTVYTSATVGRFMTSEWVDTPPSGFGQIPA